MSPFDYLWQYHNLDLIDLQLDLHTRASLTRYVNDWQPMNLVEYNAVADALSQKYFRLKDRHGMTPSFYIQGEPRIRAGEKFYLASLRRAYQGFGSPQEIRDAVRLAILADQCEPQDAKMYAESWFGTN